MRVRPLVTAACIGLIALAILALSTSLVLSGRETPPELLSRQKLFRAQVTSVDWSATGVIAAGSADRSVRIRRPSGDQTELTEFDGSIAEVRWDPSGRRLAIASHEPIRPLRMWDSITGQTQDLRSPGSQALITALEWSPDGSSLALGTNDRPSGRRDGGSVHILDAHTGGIRQTLAVPDAVQTIAWSASGELIAAGTTSASLVTPTITIWVWAVPEYRPVFQSKGTEQIDSLSWSPDDRRLAVGRIDGLIEVWDTSRGVLLHSMQVNGPATKGRALSPVEGLAWSPDGKMLASGSWDGYLRIWDGGNFAFESEYLNPDFVDDLSWSPDGHSVVTVCANGEVLIWSVK